MSGTTLRVAEVTAGYAQDQILHRVSFSVLPGEIFALLGPSGCGKSTTLKILAGLLHPWSGDVWFDQERVTALPAEKRSVAMVFQKPFLFPYLSVLDNVAFGLRMRKHSRPEQHRRAAEALEQVHLPGFGSRRTDQLSGGQEQRIALARAIVTNPRVLLLDEPFSALDVELRQQMRNLVAELQQAAGITTVFVTHDQQEAAQLGATIGFMLDGRFAQIGSAADFYVRPKTAEVARFFGWHELPQSVLNRSGWYRPERVRIAKEASTQSVPALDAHVVRVSDLGSHMAYELRTALGETLLIRTSPSAGRNGLHPGDRATAIFEPDGIVTFKDV